MMVDPRAGCNRARRVGQEPAAVPMPWRSGTSAISDSAVPPALRSTQRVGEAARDLGRRRAREPDLVEREVHERVPVHDGLDEAQRTPVVEMGTVGQFATGDLPQAVVQTVDRLDRSRRVLERRVRQRPFRDVHEQAKAVRGVLLERAFETERHGVDGGGLVDA
jgi:hypothetical protein